MEAREQKGLEIAAAMNLEKRADGIWSVPSQSKKGSYAVDAARKSCTCRDFEYRQKPCKHVLAVEIAMKRETVTETAPNGSVRTTVTETAAVRVTYPQNWPAYNAAQTTEKSAFRGIAP